MRITLNGLAHETAAADVAGLLQQLGLEGRPVLVERNKLALFARDFAATPLGDGDEIEIIQLAAGG